MMKKPKFSNLETYKLLVFDIYLQSQKNGGFITAHDVRNSCSDYKLDTHYIGKSLRQMGILTPDELGIKGKKLRLRWAAEVPSDDMIQKLFDEVYLMRHIEIRRLRQARAERRAIERAQQELEVTNQSFEEAIDEHIEQQVSPTLDSWCLKFPDEKQYFSAFGLEMMRKIGRLFSIESVKELDGH